MVPSKSVKFMQTRDVKPGTSIVENMIVAVRFEERAFTN